MIEMEFDVYLVPRRPDIVTWADAEQHATTAGVVTVNLETLDSDLTPVEHAMFLMATQAPRILDEEGPT